MATRIDNLTKIAIPIAQDMSDRYGTLKNVLSAGILVFASLSPQEREIWMAKAVGRDITKTTDLDNATPAQVEAQPPPTLRQALRAFVERTKQQQAGQDNRLILTPRDEKLWVELDKLAGIEPKKAKKQA